MRQLSASRRLLFPIILSLLIHLPALASFAAGVEATVRVEAKLSDAQLQARLHDLVQESVTALPPNLLRGLRKTVLIQASTKGSDLAKASGHRIKLGPSFIRLLALPPVTQASAVPETSTSHYPFVHQALKAALVQEIARIFDHTSSKLGRDIPRSDCPIAHPFPGDREALDMDSPCHLAKGFRYFAVSDSYEFLNLSRHHSQNRLSRRQLNNNLRDRALAQDEFKNPQDAFALNFAAFALAPEFKCRRPLMYELLSKLLEWTPHPDQACERHGTLLLNDLSDLDQDYVDIDFDRLHSVDYLHAVGTDAKISSRFGHSMLRFVFCPPSEPLSDECRKDPGNSLTLSYRGIIDDSAFTMLNDKAGRLTTTALFRRLPAVIDHYTLLHSREILSYRLKLTRLEQERVLKHAIENHWTYRSRYHFINNNCVTEAMNHLKSALAERTALQLQTPLTPEGLIDDLAEAGLIDLAQPLEDGVDRFPSRKPELLDATAALSRTIGLDIPSAEAYATLSIQQRSSLVRSALLHGNDRSLKAVLLLHQFAQKAFEQPALFQTMMEIVELSERRSGPASVADEARTSYLKVLMAVDAPGKLLGKGYGIPSQREIQGLQARLDTKELADVTANPQTDALGLSAETLGMLHKLKTTREEIQTLLENVDGHLKPSLAWRGAGAAVPSMIRGRM